MLIPETELPIVSVDFMDDIHRKDIAIINELYKLILIYEKEPTSNNRENIDVFYQKWFNYTVDHFNSEELEMKALNFPHYKVHKSEHTKVLAIMDEIFKQWQATYNIEILKCYFKNELPKWLIQHIKSIDMITANFFKTGNSPLVLEI